MSLVTCSQVQISLFFLSPLKYKKNINQTEKYLLFVYFINGFLFLKDANNSAKTFPKIASKDFRAYLVLVPFLTDFSPFSLLRTALSFTPAS